MAEKQATECTRLLLIGKTGSGKSSTGNTLLQGNFFDTSSDFCSATLDCTVHSGEVLKTRLLVMDTPGLLDTEISDEDTGVIIVKAVINMHPGPNAIIYVIGPEKFLKHDFEAFERFKKLFGADVVRHMIVLFTHGDRLERNGKTIQDKLQSAPQNLRQVVEECGGRYVVFNNETNEDVEQIQILLDKVNALWEENEHQPYKLTNYSAIGDALENEVREKMREIDQKEAEKMMDLRAEKEKAQKTIKQLEDQNSTLHRKYEEMHMEKQEQEDEMNRMRDYNKQMLESNKRTRKKENLDAACEIVEGFAKIVSDSGKLCIKAYQSAQEDEADSDRMNQRRGHKGHRRCDYSTDWSAQESAASIQRGTEHVFNNTMSRCRGNFRNTRQNFGDK